MMPRQFLYFLTNKDGNSYYLNNGVVDTTTTPTPLTNTPDGWSEVNIQWKRDLVKYFGLVRSFTTPLKFVLGAARILRDRFYKYGTEDKINLVILWVDKTFLGGWVHRNFYRGELDLSQTTDELTHVETNIMEGDLVKLFKSNENTVYEIDINGPVVQDDGVFLYQTINYLSIEQSHPGSGTVGGTRYIMNTIFLSTEGSAFGIDVSSSNAFDGIDNDTSATSNFWIFRMNQDVADLRLTWDVSFRATNTAVTGGFKMFLKTSAGRELEIYSNPSPLVIGQDYVAHIDFPFNGVAGELFFITQVYAQNPVFFIIYKESTLKISYKSRYRTTYTPTLRPVQAGQAILDKLAGPGYVFASNYLSTTWENLVITSGDAIRGIGGAKLHISMAKLFEGYNTPCNLSMSISGNVISFEPKSAAFSQAVVEDLGECSDLKIITDKDAQFAGFKIGYPELDTHSFAAINAKAEFNVTSTFTGPVTRSSAVLDLTSPFKASMYEQEIIRINLEGKTTVSDGSDNDVFLKHIERVANVDPQVSGSWYFIKYNGGIDTHYFLNTYTGFYDTHLIPQPPPFPTSINLADFTFAALGFSAMSAFVTANYPGWDGVLNPTANVSTIPTGAPYYKYKRDINATATGLLDPGTAYNLEISPAWCVRQHGNYLRSIFYWHDGERLVFQTSDTTADLGSTKGGVTINERADIVIGDLDAPLFIPLDFNFKTPMSREIVNVMRDTPAGTFQFNDPSFGVLYGYAKAVSIQPSDKPVQETILLCSPQTDILKLIH